MIGSMNKFLTLFAVLLIAVACSTTEKTTRNGDDDTSGESDQPIFDLDQDIVEAYLIEEMDEFERTLFQNRSTLSDQFVTVNYEIPEAFQKDIVRANQQLVDEFAGYRVQLLSTRSVAEADSTKDNFRVWVEENIEGYTPEAYVMFRQPYYKVRVGDFRDQQKANNFSRLLKSEYPTAWVVHDRIEPQYLPADTTEIKKVDL